MRRILKVFLSLTVIAANLLLSIGCARDNGDADAPPPSDDGEVKKIVVPAYRDYLRETVNFSEIEYKRPDIESISAAFEALANMIDENKLPYDSQLDGITKLEKGYNDILTMAAYSNIRSSSNTQDEYWSGEYEHINTLLPAFSQSVEKLLVAAAGSPHAEKFEKDYFGNGLIKKYKDGGIYTDRAVELMAKEAALEADYLQISTATVKITYLDETETVDNILSTYEKKYGADAPTYKLAYDSCMKLYEDAADLVRTDILVELFKTRRKISDELGLESYAEFAYGNIYHDYSPSDYYDFAEGIADYIVPVYIKLSTYIFNQYSPQEDKEVDRVELINDTYAMLSAADGKLAEIYSYMLQHTLYDIQSESNTRSDGAFTTYLDNYNAPYIFMSCANTVNDYTTLSHEFGHFADSYLNYSDETSLDLSEVSSQALELLALTKFDGILSNEDVEYLVVCEMENALTSLIFQGFYALFEHIAYEIPEDEISRETLNAAVAQAADKIGINSEMLNDIHYVMIPHIFLYPYYVQSYTTSATVALEIYFKELDAEGEGFKSYMELLDRGDDAMSFEEYLEEAGLKSPFEEDILKKLANRIHYELLGSNYFSESIGGNNAA